MFITSFLVFELAFCLYRSDQAQDGTPFGDFLGWHEWINDRLVKRGCGLALLGHVALLFYAGLTLKTNHQTQIFTTNSDWHIIQFGNWSIKTREHLTVGVLSAILVLNIVFYKVHHECVYLHYVDPSKQADRKLNTPLIDRDDQSGKKSEPPALISPFATLFTFYLLSAMIPSTVAAFTWSHLFTAFFWPMVQYSLATAIYLAVWIIILTKPNFAGRLLILNDLQVEK